MRTQSRTVEQELARIAEAQHGVVTRVQLLAAGVSASGIERRLRKGTLIREYPGVYRVGHRAPSIKARYLAAVRACGEYSVLSGRAAGHLLRLLKGSAPQPEVTTLTERHIEAFARAGRGRLTAGTRPSSAVFRSPPWPARSWTSRPFCHRSSWLARVTRQGCSTARLPRRLRLSSRDGETAGMRQSCHGCCAARYRSPSASSSSAFWSSCNRQGFPCRAPTVPRGAAAWIAAGRSSGLPSSSTASATTSRDTPGSKIAAASEKHMPAVTSFVVTPMAMTSSTRV
jgi:Transcriptional regulator, AbiEi antitoxin